MMRSCLRRSPRYASGNSCSLVLFFVCLFAFNYFLSSLFLIFVTILMKLMFHSPPQKKTIKVIIIIIMIIIIIAIAIIVRGIFVHRLASSLICLERVIVFLVYLSNAQHFSLNSF